MSVPVHILPRRGEPRAAEATQILQDLVAQPLNVVVVLFENDKNFPLQQATAQNQLAILPRASVLVIVPADNSLDEDLVKEMRGNDKSGVGAIYGLDDQICAKLKAGHVLNPLKFELQLAKVGQGGS